MLLDAVSTRTFFSLLLEKAKINVINSAWAHVKVFCLAGCFGQDSTHILSQTHSKSTGCIFVCPKNAKSTIDMVTNMSVLIKLVFVFVFTMKRTTRNWSGHLFIQNIQQFFFLPFIRGSTCSVGCFDHHGRWSLGGEYLLIKKFLYPWVLATLHAITLLLCTSNSPPFPTRRSRNFSQSHELV